MFNIVELAADNEEQEQAPCKWGNIVTGHACYCHNDAWREAPRKCPIWRKVEDSTGHREPYWGFVVDSALHPNTQQSTRVTRQRNT